jgi:lysophospholipase L1-like esterase
VREWSFRAVAIALALLLFEGGLRALDLPRTDTCWAPKESYWLPDGALGFAYRPGAQVARGTINALGTRGPVPPPDESPEPLRLLVVGDSTAYGYGVADDESFWSLAARAIAAAHPGAPVEPIVAAAPGYSSWQSRVLVERMLPYGPAWVVFYVGAYNDHRRRSYYPDDAIPARMQRRRAAWHAIRTLRAGELAADLAGRWIDRTFRERVATVRVPPDAFAANMAAMLDLTRRSGARAIVLVPPFSPKLRAKVAAIPRYEAILHDEAARAGARVIELGPLFDDVGADFQADQIHPSAAGQAKIADAVSAAILADSPGL